jgi:Xaa-Pro aminopeptidase
LGADLTVPIQEAIRREGLDGWLFCGFQHRDPLAERILGLDPRQSNTRRWVYAIPARGEPLGIVPAVEAHVLGDLPGSRQLYVGLEEFRRLLGPLGGLRWAAHISPTLSAISYLDGGTADLFAQEGLILVSAASLIQRFRGLLDSAGMASIEAASADLHRIVGVAWAHAVETFKTGEALHEGDLRSLILREFKGRRLVSHGSPIVAAGSHAGDPHYDFVGPGKRILPGEVIQFDIWAKKDTAVPGQPAIYADISWVGRYCPEPSVREGQRVERAFQDLVEVREEVLAFIQLRFAEGRALTGAEVDSFTRRALDKRGYAGAIKHRTGHGIDTDVHGCGVNMDAIEFPDERFLLEGSCFSLEPGIYFEDFGLRTEIDLYIRDGKPVIAGEDSGYRRQFSLLYC